MSEPFIAKLQSRTLLVVTGEDATRFLQGVVTQDVASQQIGEARFASLLTPQGKILFDFFLLKRADGFLLDCTATAAADLKKRLTMYKLRAQVTIDEAPGEIHATWGGDDAGRGVADPRGVGRRIYYDAVAPTATEDDYNVYRINQGFPEFGRDFGSDERFLLDVNFDALNAVSYAKGCFVGQEVTSRMKRKGEIRKRTVIISAEDALHKGASVVCGDATLGEVTSATGATGLALIRLDRWRQLDEDRVIVNGALARLTLPDYLESA